MTDTVEACPHCDSTGVQLTGPGGINTQHPDADRYRCQECGETFDETETRESEHSAGNLQGLSKRLAETAPDEL